MPAQQDPGSGVHMSAFAHTFGSPFLLEEIEDEDLQRHLAALYEQGLKYCRVAESPVIGLAAACSRETLAAAGGAEVGAVVFCTDTSPELTPTSEVWDLLLELGMPRTPVMFVGGSGCGNLGPGLSVARSLILLDGVPRVLLVTSDRMGARSRFLDNGMTVMSDGAASCLVSARPAGPGFVLRGLASSFRADIGTVAARRIPVARATAEAVEDTVGRVIEPLSLAAGDFRYLLTGNYGHTPREFLASATGVPLARVYCPMLDQTGHCFAADGLVGLESLLETGSVDDGDHAMLLAASPRSWSVAVLRCTLGNIS